MTELLDSQIALRRDAVYMKTETGIVFRTRKGVFAFNGKTIYGSFQKLLPYLNGKHSGADLLDAAADGSRKSISEFLVALVDRDVLRLSDEEGASDLGERACEVFASQLDFIRHYADKPYERFLQFRTKRILLVGDGAAVTAAGLAFLRNGLETLHVRGCKPAAIDVLERQCAELANAGVACGVSQQQAGEVDFEVVVYCSEAPDLRELRRLNAAATEQGYYFLPAIVHNGSMLIGPIVDPLQPGCWECAMLRWSDNTDGGKASTFWQEVALGRPAWREAREASEITAQILGNAAALEVFKLCIGDPGPESRAKLLKQDLSTLESAVKPILPHADCTACLQVRSWQSRTPVSEPEVVGPSGVPVLSEFIRPWLPYIDEEFGFFKKFSDEDIEQIPLRVSVVDFAVPKYGSQSAIGWSLESSDAARIHALQKSLQFQVAVAASTSLRRILPEAEQGSSPKRVAPSQIYGWLGAVGDEAASDERHFAFACRNGGELVLVPAAAVHRDFDAHGAFDAHSAGIGVDADPQRAMQAALLSLYQRVAIERLAQETLPAVLWDATEGSGERTTQYLLATAGHLELNDWDILLTSPGEGVHTAILVPKGKRMMPVQQLILATRFSPSEAVDAVLAERIVRAQMQHGGRAWVDVALRTGIYAGAEVCLRLGDPPAQAAAERKTVVWRDITPPEVEMTGTFRVVKALLVSVPE